MNDKFVSVDTTTEQDELADFDRLKHAFGKQISTTETPKGQPLALEALRSALLPPKSVLLPPKIVCLCGSTRFMDAFQEANLKETIAGKIVLSIGCNTKSDADLMALGELTEESKAMLDQLHLRKIDLADEVLILNVGGYVGSSTRNEILYAARLKKQLRWLEPFGIPEDLRGELVEVAFLNWEDLP